MTTETKTVIRSKDDSCTLEHTKDHDGVYIGAIILQWSEVEDFIVTLRDALSKMEASK